LTYSGNAQLGTITTGGNWTIGSTPQGLTSTGTITIGSFTPISSSVGSMTTSSIAPPTVGATFTNTATITYLPGAAVLNTTQGTINRASVKLLNAISANTASKTLSSTSNLNY